jgi:hypothetical protein
LAFLGELQHGVYDDECKGLTGEEINAFYDFDNDGESQFFDKSPDKTDEDSDEYDDEYLEKPEVDEERNRPESEDDHDVIIQPFIIQ